jgi:hypothetical protein
MTGKRFRLVARVSSASPKAIKPILERAVTNGSVKEAKDEFVVEAEMVGDRQGPEPVPPLRAEKGGEEDQAARRMDLRRRDHAALLRLRPEEDVREQLLAIATGSRPSRQTALSPTESRRGGTKLNINQVGPHILQ